MLTCRVAAFICFLNVQVLLAQDLNILPAIKEQAFSRSQAAEDVFYLADVFGPRFMDSPGYVKAGDWRSEEHTSELQSPCNLVCRLLLEKKKNYIHCSLR